MYYNDRLLDDYSSKMYKNMSIFAQKKRLS